MALGFMVLMMATACIFGACVAWKSAKTRFRRHLESAQARWQLQHQVDSKGILIESFTLGWLNLILQSLWTPILEKHVAGLTADLLQRVLHEVLAKNAHKGVWKFIESITLEEISFGLVPPTFQNALAKYDPAKSILHVAVDAKFSSTSAQVVVRLLLVDAVD
eukprot:gene11068-11224_t